MTRHFAGKVETLSFIAIVTLLGALVALAQEAGTTQPSEKPAARFVPQYAGSGLQQPQRLVATGTVSQSVPPSRSHRKKEESGVADSESVSFFPVVTYDSIGAAGGAYSGSLAVADVNGDGKPDLIVANTPTYGVGSIGVLLGNGDGTFQPVALNTSVGQVGEFNALAVADLNGDGKPDLVVVTCCASNGDFQAAVLLGNGDGTFQSAVKYDGGGQQSSLVVVGDVNGDGRPDIVVVNWVDSNSQATANVLLGNGDGTFQPFVSSNASPDPGCATLADVNHDGKLDLLICGEDSVVVLLGNGDGTFQSYVDRNFYTGYCTTAAVVADVNGDGFPDMVAPNAGGNGCGSQGFAGILLGNGDGTFQTEVDYLALGYTYLGVGASAVGDLNGDGKPDVMVTTGLGLYGSVHGSVGVVLGNGDGIFQTATSFDAGGSQTQAVVAADLNGDGKLDIVVANFGSGTVGVLLNNTGFAQTPTSTTLGSSPNPSIYGQSAIFSAAVTSSSGTPTGTVIFYDGANSIGSATLANGNAAIAVSSLTAASHTITAAYQGAGAFQPSTSSPLTQVVSAASTSTSLISTANPAHVKQSVTYIATVTGQFGGAATGSVMFADGGATIATMTVAGNQAAYSTSYATEGTHSITATYSGDANNAGSASSVLMEVIGNGKAPDKSVTTLATSGSPSFVGQSVTFTATVTSTGGPIPDGELVTFYDGNSKDETEIGTGTTAGGVATFTTAMLAAEGHTIRATYPGDATFQPSSGKVKQVVNKYTTTTTLVSSMNPSYHGDPPYFTVTVISAGGPTPTGEVFVTGYVGTATLSGGTATLQMPDYSPGKRHFTAFYRGDAFNDTSKSQVLIQVVKPK
jgi:hypothetical protein